MKKLIVALLVLSAVPAFAGKMKAIWEMTNESVLAELGFDEGIVAIEGHKFLQIPNADLAVQTQVRGYYRTRGEVPLFTCVTYFAKFQDFFEVTHTECEKAN
ncbi:MAG: hypothetical protein OM95_01790 [Bdellovibrio sp. ArHS]|uniref:hypothetical protein n=1 Tax=Bdellovibrio sp. ArHS TaxID=1569284 RepID=UPI000582DE98|nr:hypothetical protein [Bdellovibrio sp. ArHS]KHD89820.1 MAG: hypothetical protein OM95_01790 [Bdellovibrio sp. ArHS]